MANNFRVGRLLRAVQYVLPAGTNARIAQRLYQRGTAARQAGHHLSAAVLYEEALRFTPRLAGLHVQAGHMFKEGGDFEAAEQHYDAAKALNPDDPDLAMQFGHFYKLAGRPDESRAAYARALSLRPGWGEAADELAAATASFDGGENTAIEADPALLDRLAPELLPRRSPQAQRSFRDGLHVRRLGARRERSRWGTMKTLRGVEAIRGFCISSVPIEEVQLVVDEAVVHRETPQVHDLGDPAGRQRKYVFNVWFDFSGFASGRYQVELRCIDARSRVLIHRQHVVIAPAETDADRPSSDAQVAIDPRDSRPVEVQIDARPSEVRRAERTLFPRPPRTVLVQRADQLGDLVVSVPAILRLRELLPEARLVGLLSPANADLARSLGIFDAVEVADFRDDPDERRRVMTLEAQQELRQRLSRYGFDMAIDLSEGGGSRPLLLLSGAPFLYGFRTAEAPWLSADVHGMTHDPVNRLESVSATTKLVGLVEWLGVMMGRHAVTMPPADADRKRLVRFGIGEGERYLVLHTGARLAFSRWPHFAGLATAVLERTDLKVVMLSDDPAAAEALPPALVGSDRFRLITEQLPFAEFDALLSFCATFVGNDTGPKHLASLRGAPVVALHTARHNWNEWGQEHGLVVSRRVPCAGCAIHHEPEECGRDFACIRKISIEDVFNAVMRSLAAEDGAAL